MSVLRPDEWSLRELVDGRAAVRATTVAVLAVVLVVLTQGVVGAAVTGGQQPMAAVESVPASATAAQWNDAPTKTVSMSKQQMAIPYGGGSVANVTVQALTNESHVAFRLSWHDPTNDTSLAAPRAYSDAVAVMLYNGSAPPITMGATGTPVNIWYWRAAWEYGERTSEWTGDMYAYPHPDNATKPGLNVSNPLSKARYERYAQNYYAKGYGSLSHAPEQNVDAESTRRDEEWAVTFVRERQTAGTYDAQFDTDRTMYLAFAVWNGSADEVNGEKSLTFRFLTLDTATGELAQADTGGSGESGGTTPTGTPTGGSVGFGMSGYIGMLVAVTLLTWTVTYWREIR